MNDLFLLRFVFVFGCITTVKLGYLVDVKLSFVTCAVITFALFIVLVNLERNR